MKTAILKTFCGESHSHCEIVQVEDDFCFGVSDPYGDLVPFTVGSNQTIIEPPHVDEIENHSFA